MFQKCEEDTWEEFDPKLVQEGEKGQVRDSEGRGELFPFTRIRQRTIGKLRCSFPLLFLLIVSPLYKREFVMS